MRGTSSLLTPLWIGSIMSDVLSQQHPTESLLGWYTRKGPDNHEYGVELSHMGDPHDEFALRVARKYLNQYEEDHYGQTLEGPAMARRTPVAEESAGERPQ